MWTSHQPRSFWIYIIKSKSPVLNSLFSCTKPDSENCKNGTDQNSERPRILGFLPMVWRTVCSSSLTSWSHSFDLVAPCPPPSLPLIPQAGITLAVPVFSGILKFHEHYLGDNTVENSSDLQTGSSTALPTATSSALEQHIASVREALGVESYYSR